MIDNEGRTWPDDPTEHIMLPPKKRKPIDSNYKYRRKSPLYKLYSGLLRVLALIFLPIGNFYRYHFSISGRKYLRHLRKTGFIVVANHVLHMDAAIISSSIFNTKKLHFIILGPNAKIPVAGSIITALGGIPIADDLAGARKFIKHCNFLLEKRKPILIFPEKAMWHGYKGIRPFDNGAFKIAVMNKVPILPIVITLKNRGKTQANQKYKVYFNIQPPVYADENLSGPEKINALNYNVHNIFIDKTNEFYKNIEKNNKK